MKSHAFYILDVFAEEKYSGNQLAVVASAETLSDHLMQKIANEMHFSETTFIDSKRKREGCHKVRIFTPKVEVPFAGHPTLGTAYVIRHFVEDGGSEPVVLELKAGKIPVTFENSQENGEVVWMNQSSPVFGKTFDFRGFQSLLGLEASDFELKHPVQEVSTGLPFIIAPLKNLDAVKRARVNQSILTEVIRDTPVGILVFCPETYREENDLNVRVFVDAFGIPEDPATGSGNGCLGAYLSRYEVLGGSQVNVRVEQGFEIGRPSILQVRAKCEEKQLQVCVGGKVVLIAKGELL